MSEHSEGGYSDDEFEEELVAKPMFTGPTPAQEEVSDEEELDHDDEESLEDEDCEEEIEKLRIANDALRKQLKHFQRVFEATLNANGPAAGSGGTNQRSEDNGKKSLRAIVASKQKQVQSLKKKLEMYKKNNSQLKRQVHQAYTSDRVAQMGNDNKQKERQIQTLVEQNRNLMAIQRSQAKKIHKQETDKDEWPVRMAGLQDELRVARETLRKYKSKAKAAEEESKRQRAAIIKLQDKQKELVGEIRRYEATNGKAPTREMLDLDAQREKWDEEKTKLQKNITVLEKANKNERMKASQATRKAEEKVKEKLNELTKLKEVLEEKDKDMRYQVIQIKKLKRGLRELAMGDVPLPESLVNQPWSVNFNKFIDGVESETGEDHDEAEPKPSQQNIKADDDERQVGNNGSSSSGLLAPSSPESKPPSERGPRTARTENSTSSNSSSEDSPAVTESPRSLYDAEETAAEQEHEQEVIQVSRKEEEKTEVVKELLEEEEKLPEDVKAREIEIPVEMNTPDQSEREQTKTDSQQPKSAFAKPMMGAKKKKKKKSF